MRSLRWLLLTAALAAAVLAWLTRTPQVALDEPDAGQLRELAARGEYLLRAGGCTGCHSVEDDDANPLAGGRALASPFGTFYTPNITPDPDTGIGEWSARDFVRAMRYGRDPHGNAYFPGFPYTAYAAMRSDDMLSLYAYLMTVPPIRRENRPHELPWYLASLPAARAWQLMFFRTAPLRDDPAQSPEYNRGAYLAQALGHCGECHTPRDGLGVLDPAMHLAGTRDGPDGDPVPNITPDRDTGIGRWRARDLRDFLHSGMTPDGDFTGGHMAEVVDGGLQYLTREDLDALVAYLRGIPAIEHKVTRGTRQGD